MGKKLFLRMREKIGKRHFAGEDESNRAGEHAKEKKNAAGELQNSRDAQERQEPNVVEHFDMRKAEELRRTVLEQQQGRDDPQESKKPRLPSSGDGRQIHDYHSFAERTSHVRFPIAGAVRDLDSNAKYFVLYTATH